MNVIHFCCLAGCSAVCRGSATLEESCVKLEALPSFAAPDLAETMPAETELGGQLSIGPFDHSGPPTAPALEAATEPLASAMTPVHGSIRAPTNAPTHSPRLCQAWIAQLLQKPHATPFRLHPHASATLPKLSRRRCAWGNRCLL